jgi:acetyl esterase/lipase
MLPGMLHHSISKRITAMKRFMIALCALVGSAVVIQVGRAGDNAPHTRVSDVVYGRKEGVALTMDVFTPKKNANGAAVIWVVSGGWVSSHAAINPAFAEPFTKRGYTVFEVVHGSQPRFTIPEILPDIHRSVRFIRSRAKEYNIDPDRIGISGVSAGGHLSLMQGVTGNAGNPKAADPVDRVSSKVQAVACFVPPTDFLNWGEKGKEALGRGPLAAFKAPFDFKALDPKTRTFERITDETKFLEIGKAISPITHVTAKAPPTLILHGEKDALVPIQQAEIMIAKLKEAEVPAELYVKKGAGHVWGDMLSDISRCADWYDKHLKKVEN